MTHEQQCEFITYANAWWRAYARGDYDKATKWYTDAVNSEGWQVLLREHHSIQTGSASIPQRPIMLACKCTHARTGSTLTSLWYWAA